MTDQAIPSLLKSKLQELESNGTHPPFFIEVGPNVVSIAMERSRLLTLQSKKTTTPQKTALANRPSVLLLLSQEQLEKWMENSNNSACQAFTCLPETQSPRADLSSLHDESKVLVTTPQRAIDHIRRDNIFLSETKSVILAYSFNQGPEETLEQLLVRECAFLDDCRFIFTKLQPNVKIEFFISNFSHLTRTPQELVEQPLVVLQSEWERSLLHLECYASSKLATNHIVDTLYALQQEQYHIIYKAGVQWETLVQQLRTLNPPISYIGISLDRFSSMPEPKPGTLGTLIAIGLNSGDIISLIRQLHEWDHLIPRIVCINTPQEVQEIITSKETLLMNNEIKSIPETKEVIAGKIQMLIAKLTIDSNPEELESLRKIIKKNVPLLRRGYFTAYLLRELLGSEKQGTSKSRNGQPSKRTPVEASTEKPSRAKRQPAKPRSTPPPIPEGARTLYLNIGKMRRLYAKELSQIFQDQLGIKKEELYSIRVHDKYSFITLPEAYAEKAIEKMNGLDIRGRTATISYSNKE